MYLVFIDVTFLENAPFSPDPIHTSQVEHDDLLVYTLASLAPAYVPPLTKLPITIVVKGARRTKAQRPLGALRRKANLRRGLFHIRRTIYIYITL